MTAEHNVHVIVTWTPLGHEKCPDKNMASGNTVCPVCQSVSIIS